MNILQDCISLLGESEDLPMVIELMITDNVVNAVRRGHVHEYWQPFVKGGVPTVIYRCESLHPPGDPPDARRGKIEARRAERAQRRRAARPAIEDGPGNPLAAHANEDAHHGLPAAPANEPEPALIVDGPGNPLAAPAIEPEPALIVDGPGNPLAAPAIEPEPMTALIVDGPLFDMLIEEAVDQYYRDALEGDPSTLKTCLECIEDSPALRLELDFQSAPLGPEGGAKLVLAGEQTPTLEVVSPS